MSGGDTPIPVRATAGRRRATRQVSALIAAAVAALVAGCAVGEMPVSVTAAANTTSATPAAPAGAGSGVPVGSPATSVPGANTCTLGHRNGQPIPDPRCTPGALNPNVSQTTIAGTICVTGWTATIRPPVSRTNRLKKQLAAAYRLPPTSQGELDHLVSLELGGAPADPRNLWVEPGTIPNPKDAVENKLNDAVCSRLIPLASAQHAIATSWTTAIDDTGLAVLGGKLCLRQQPTRCATGRHPTRPAGQTRAVDPAQADDPDQ
jgi:hypothetical protein